MAEPKWYTRSHSTHTHKVGGRRERSEHKKQTKWNSFHSHIQHYTKHTYSIRKLRKLENWYYFGFLFFYFCFLYNILFDFISVFLFLVLMLIKVSGKCKFRLLALHSFAWLSIGLHMASTLLVSVYKVTWQRKKVIEAWKKWVGERIILYSNYVEEIPKFH